MSEQPQRRRHSWTKAQSDSFSPIKQVGVAVAIGLPLMVVGVLLLALLTISLVGATTALWILGGVLALGGLIAALSGRVI
jgi:hypothetical protein